MTELTGTQIDELRSLQDMANKGFAAWTNENFQDLLATYDRSQATCEELNAEAAGLKALYGVMTYLTHQQTRRTVK